MQAPDYHNYYAAIVPTSNDNWSTNNKNKYVAMSQT